MARRATHAPLNVFLNNRHVGRLTRHSSGAIDFAYDRDWLAWEHAIPVSLSLPLRETRYLGDRVTAVFENLLPDSRAIRTRVAERVGANGIDAFSLLSQIGRDCVGALQFTAVDDLPPPTTAIDEIRQASDKAFSSVEDALPASDPCSDCRRRPRAPATARHGRRRARTNLTNASRSSMSRYQ